MSATEKKAADEDLSLIPENLSFEPGFNMKTVWAALFVGFVMLPGAIYLGLVTGQSMAGGAEWVTLILFIEIAKRSFVRLRTQEVIILYWVAAGLVTMGGKLGTGADLFGGPFGGLIWDQYLIQSPQADGLHRYIPDWLVPPRGSDALLQRSFLHEAWIKPITLLLSVIVLSKINSLSLGYVLFRITNDIEKLPYPLAGVQAGGATALAESSGQREGWRWEVFSVGAFIGIIWGLIYVVIPTVSGIFLTQTVTLLPIPFIDLTVSMKELIPAGIMGVGTDLGHLLMGFVLPFWVVVGGFAASMLVNLVANPILYNFGILHTWDPGMSTLPTQLANTFDFWLSFSIGGAGLVALMGFWMVGSIMYRLRGAKREGTSQSTAPPPGRGDMPIPLALLIWAVSTAGFVVLVYWLVPGFPWWISAFFGFVWTPINSYIGARMIGLTGSPQGVSFPFLREGSFYLSGYQGAAVWFAPVPLFQWGFEAAAFKQLELTKTNFGSIVKLAAVTLLIMFVCSFLFWSFIWKLGPIPSAAFPYVQKFWPYHATMQAFWAKSTLPEGAGNLLVTSIIRWEYILTGFISSFGVLGLLTVLKVPVAAFYGFIGGINGWPHFFLLNFAGAMLGRYYFQRRFGEKRWRVYTPILLAGYSCGIGLVGMSSIAVALISKAVSNIVF
ncbi:MAG: peptide transporter [Candidatus Latescibacteria bacterium]|nr:peptide transporter [Candidatus Latescibacterota bacterium]